MSKGYSGLFQHTIGCQNKSIDFYVGSNGKIVEAKHRHWIGVSRRNRFLRKAKNPKLINLINQLYRPGSFIGDGGAASALKFEYSTGLGLGKNGNFHARKALETLKFIDNKILSDATLSHGDRKLAKTLKSKLIQALGDGKDGR